MILAFYVPISFKQYKCPHKTYLIWLKYLNLEYQLEKELQHTILTALEGCLELIPSIFISTPGLYFDSLNSMEVLFSNFLQVCMDCSYWILLSMLKQVCLLVWPYKKIKLKYWIKNLFLTKLCVDPLRPNFLYIHLYWHRPG